MITKIQRASPAFVTDGICRKVKLLLSLFLKLCTLTLQPDLERALRLPLNNIRELKQRRF